MAPMDNRFLCPRSKGDPDALAYIAAVQQADGEPLEQAVKTAIEAFVVGCKADSAGYAGDPTRTVWDALQACCILCGARTIAGALVPLAGTAPTAVNFVSANYNRETGLVGVPASGTYINTNRANNADGINDSHYFVNFSQTPTANAGVLGSTGAFGGNQRFLWSLGSNTDYRVAVNGNVDIYTSSAPGFTAGNAGASRASAATIKWRFGSVSSEPSNATISQDSGNICLFGPGTTGGKSNPRIAFYSIGSAVDLALLDARVTTLVTQIAAAIP